MTPKTSDGSARRSDSGISYFEAFGIIVVTIALTYLAYAKVLGPRHYFYSLPALSELEGLSKFDLGERSSRNFEELIVRDVFNDRRGVTFLDVGANHYKDESNTYYLETALGWSGLAIDALDEFGADYKVHRPRTRFVAMFASDVADQKVQFFVAPNSLVSSVSEEFTKREGSPGSARTVPTTTLNAVLDQARIGRVDFMSMDIELAEPKALAGFDIDRFKPELVCIEAHLEVRQQILDYFARHGYVALGKYLRIDPHNLYFARL
ncbi:MAG: FkbM family methyltransferase [Acidobacteriota bacterium]|nr:FkbM family methyltransferase [Acidobacteriota bacterium]